MILIVASQFDKSEDNVIQSLIGSAIEVLEAADEAYKLIRVPGAVEIPVTIKHFLDNDVESYQAAIALGCVIKGESDHYELVSKSVTDGLTQLSLDTGVPIIQGVLACHNASQAIDRKNHGAEFAQTALEMKQLFANMIN